MQKESLPKFLSYDLEWLLTKITFSLISIDCCGRKLS